MASTGKRDDTRKLMTTNVNLVLEGKGITLDESGRISFVDPKIVQALVTARPDDLGETLAGNTVQCGCNNYQCKEK